jgi:hypothetical protein
MYRCREKKPAKVIDTGNRNGEARVGYESKEPESDV